MTVDEKVEQVGLALRETLRALDKLLEEDGPTLTKPRQDVRQRLHFAAGVLDKALR